MLLLLITVAFAAQSKWRTECNSQAVASWNNIDDKTGFGKAFFKNWLTANPSIEQVFADSSFKQGPAQFLVERFDILLNVIDDEEQLAEQLYQVAKTHKKVGVDQSDLYSFQASFMKTLPEFDSDFTPEVGNAWAYTLSHVITAPLVEMAAVTSSYVGVRVVRDTWKKVDDKKVCDTLLTKVMDTEISDFFQGVDKKKQSLLFCSFVDVIMDGLTLPGDDSEKRNSQMKQLAAFHNGMGVGGSAYLIFEEALINSFRDVLGPKKWDRTTKHSFVYALHKQVFDVLVRYTQKWHYAEWKAPVRAAEKSCSE